MDVADALAGLEEHLGKVERRLFAAGDQVQAVLAAQKAGDTRPFGEVALALGLVSQDALKKYLDSVKGA